jgi:hypothetical protein
MGGRDEWRWLVLVTRVVQSEEELESEEERAVKTRVTQGLL